MQRGDAFVSCGNERSIRRAEKRDAEVLTMLAGLLWPDNDPGDLRGEMESILEADDGAIFICLNGGKPTGFAHCSLRHDYVEGSEKNPTAYLEGIFVMPGHRGEGAASELLRHCESWAAEMGCAEIASDCELENLESARFHSCKGFLEVNRIICFVKKLKA